MRFSRLGSNTSPAYFAESELNVRKLLLKRLVHVFLQVGRFDVFYHRRLEGKKDEIRCFKKIKDKEDGENSTKERK